MTSDKNAAIDQSYIEESIDEECPDCGSTVYEVRWYLFGVIQSGELICSGCRKTPREMDGSMEGYARV